MRLPGLWARSKHCEEGISAGNERNSCQPGRIHTLRTGNDDSVANLNIGDRNSWQSFEHVVDIEAAAGTRTTGSTATRTAGALWTLWSAASITSATSRSAALTATGASEATHHSHFRRKAPQHSVLLDHDGERNLFLQFFDMDLTGCGIDGRHDAADCPEGSSHDFLRIETEWVFSSIAEST